MTENLIEYLLYVSLNTFAVNGLTLILFCTLIHKAGCFLTARAYHCIENAMKTTYSFTICIYYTFSTSTEPSVQYLCRVYSNLVPVVKCNKM